MPAAGPRHPPDGDSPMDGCWPVISPAGAAAPAGWAMASANRLRKVLIVAAATRCKIARLSPAPRAPRGGR